MTNADKWKEFVEWWKQESKNWYVDDQIYDLMWVINKKIKELQKGNNAKQ